MYNYHVRMYCFQKCHHPKVTDIFCGILNVVGCIVCSSVCVMGSVNTQFPPYSNTRNHIRDRNTPMVTINS